MSDASANQPNSQRGERPAGGSSARSPGGERADAPDSRPALFAPWRLEYLEAMDKHERSAGVPAAGSPSFLDQAWQHPEQDGPNHVIVRSERGMVLLNAFPYANGHLLIALGDARPTLLDYQPEQRDHLWCLVELASELVQRTVEPQGLNIGINQGRAAGAGVPQHLHVHIVPRWQGDTNVMEVVAGVCVIPGALDAMAERYRAQWHLLQEERPSVAEQFRPPAGA